VRPRSIASAGGPSSSSPEAAIGEAGDAGSGCRDARRARVDGRARRCRRDETASRTTHENAVLTGPLLRARSAQRLRARDRGPAHAQSGGRIQAQGLDVLAAPTGHLTTEEFRISEAWCRRAAPPAGPAGAARMVGLGWYRLRVTSTEHGHLNRWNLNHAAMIAIAPAPRMRTVATITRHPSARAPRPAASRT